MDPIQSLILGIVQGLTEFIPVSSSGHLQLIPDALGWQAPSLIFILFAHLGTLLALVVYFRRDLWEFAKAVYFTITGTAEQKSAYHDRFHLLWKIALATVPAAILGILFESRLDDFYTNQSLFPLPAVITAIAMLLLGALFLFENKIFAKPTQKLANFSYPRALAIGVSQVLAFLRGTSRSGVTVLAGQAVGLSRVEAAKFSFLMSIPIVTATSLFAILELFDLPAAQLQAEAANGLIAVVTAFVSGFIAIRFLLRYLQSRGLAAFGWYRIVFALAALAIILL